jgi:hypothetical protein
MQMHAGYYENEHPPLIKIYARVSSEESKKRLYEGYKKARIMLNRGNKFKIHSQTDELTISL